MGTGWRLSASASSRLPARGKPELVAVGVADLVEYVQGLCPCPVRSGGVPGAMMDVTEAAKRGGLVVAVRAFPADADGALVAGNSLLVVAEVVADVGQAAPDRGLPASRAYLLDQLQ